MALRGQGLNCLCQILQFLGLDDGCGRSDSIIQDIQHVEFRQAEVAVSHIFRADPEGKFAAVAKRNASGERVFAVARAGCTRSTDS